MNTKWTRMVLILSILLLFGLLLLARSIDSRTIHIQGMNGNREPSESTGAALEETRAETEGTKVPVTQETDTTPESGDPQTPSNGHTGRAEATESTETVAPTSPEEPSVTVPPETAPVPESSETSPGQTEGAPSEESGDSWETDEF